MIPAKRVVQIQCFWSHMKADTSGYGVSFFEDRRTKFRFLTPKKSGFLGNGCFTKLHFLLVKSEITSDGLQKNSRHSLKYHLSYETKNIGFGRRVRPESCRQLLKTFFFTKKHACVSRENLVTK